MPRGIYKIPRPAWNKGLTKETDSRLCRSKESIEKQKSTVLEKYGVSNVFRSKEVLERIEDDRHSGLLAKKAMQTKLERYGDKNYNNIEQMLQTKEERYGDSSYNNFEKYRETCLQKYGVDHVSKTQGVKDKISKTRI